MSPAERQRAAGLHSLGLGTAALHIAEDAPPFALMEDLRCMFDTGMGALENISEVVACLSDTPAEIRERWFAMLYVMRASQGMLHRLYEVMPHDSAKAVLGGRT